ncbi:MAG: hypothetical protein ACOY93_00850 [Bacillota bacterium]
MDARRWIGLMALLLLMAVMAGGCAGNQQSKRPEVDFTPVPLEEAPPELRQYYEQTRTVPGLFVLQKDGETYLLLMAGPVSEPGLAVRVAEIRRMGKDWRVAAALLPDGEGAEYPCAVVRLKAPLNAAFKARLTGPEGEVMELRGMILTDR